MRLLNYGIRFYDERKKIVCEEFLGFSELKAMDARTISDAIDNFMQPYSLDPLKCVGQGYDGCSTMAGAHGGVQTILREKYPKALYFHCANHKLNLVVNDLNAVPEIRNTIGTIKEIIKFFRESVLRRQVVPNIPPLCETRWSEKYRSISIFKANFEKIVSGLDTLSKDGNRETRAKAFQLHCAATKSTFIISTFLIAKYSTLLEPVVNALQAKSIDLFSCSTHIKRILTLVRQHRANAEEEIQTL